MVLRESDMTKINAKRKSPGRIWPDWYPVLATFRNSDNRKAAWQLINTVVPYCGLWYLMIRSIQLGHSYALTLILALPAAAFMVRLFILFHDCVHGSFHAYPVTAQFAISLRGPRLRGRTGLCKISHRSVTLSGRQFSVHYQKPLMARNDD